MILFLITSCHNINYTTYITYQNGDKEVLHFEIRSDFSPPYLKDGCLQVPTYSTTRCGIRSIYNTIN